MFEKLITSERHWSRTPWIAGSFVLHIALVATAVFMTVTQSSRGPVAVQEYTHLVFMPGLRPPSQATGATWERKKKTIGNPARPLATPTVTQPIHEVTSPNLPVISPEVAPTPSASGMQVNAATAGDGTEANAAGNKETIYVPGGGMIGATLVPGTPSPVYPVELVNGKNAKTVVTVTYIIDTLGQAEEGSIQVVSTQHALFGEAVRTWLTHVARFKPAQLIDGTKVRQRAVQDITFVNTSR